MRAKDKLTHAAEIFLARVVEDDLFGNGGSRRGIHVQRRRAMVSFLLKSKEIQKIIKYIYSILGCISLLV